MWKEVLGAGEWMGAAGGSTDNSLHVTRHGNCCVVALSACWRDTCAPSVHCQVWIFPSRLCWLWHRMSPPHTTTSSLPTFARTEAAATAALLLSPPTTAWTTCPSSPEGTCCPSTSTTPARRGSACTAWRMATMVARMMLSSSTCCRSAAALHGKWGQGDKATCGLGFDTIYQGAATFMGA